MASGNKGNGDAHLGHWGYSIALILTVLIVGLLAYSQGRVGERRDKSPYIYSESAKAYVERSCAGLNVTATFECINDAVEASSETARAEQDLDAQQWMAFWALLMVIVSTVTAVVTAIGVWLVKRTLEATLEAVMQSGEATKAMHRSNEIAEVVASNNIEANQAIMRQTEINVRQFKYAYKPTIIPQFSGKFIDIDVFSTSPMGVGEKTREIALTPQITITNESDNVCEIEGVRFDIPLELQIRRYIRIYSQDNGRGTIRRIKKGEAIDLITAKGSGEANGITFEKLAFAKFFCNESSLELMKQSAPPIYVTIDYRDPIGIKRRLGFAYKPDGYWTDTYERWGGKEYNYDIEIDDH